MRRLRAGFGIRFLAFVGAAATVSCATVRDVYLHPLADPTAYRKIVVLPFENLSGDGSAARVVEDGFLLALLRYGSFEVVYPGDIGAIVAAENIRPGRTDRVLAKLKQRLECDGGHGKSSSTTRRSRGEHLRPPSRWRRTVVGRATWVV